MPPFEARLDFPSQPDWLGIYNALPHNESKRSGFKPIQLLRCFVFANFIIEQNELSFRLASFIMLYERGFCEGYELITFHIQI